MKVTINGMTLGEAVFFLSEPVPCACLGPGPWPRCFCGQLATKAGALKRAAHIVVKLIAGRGTPEVLAQVTKP
jgi:hypothetical protein